MDVILKLSGTGRMVLMHADCNVLGARYAPESCETLAISSCSFGVVEMYTVFPQAAAYVSTMCEFARLDK